MMLEILNRIGYTLEETPMGWACFVGEDAVIDDNGDPIYIITPDIEDAAREFSVRLGIANAFIPEDTQPD